MRVTADADRCVGSGMCALTVPQVFTQDDTDGTVRVIDHEPPPALHEAVNAAVYQCPARAIEAA